MIYSFWDIECDRLKLVIMGHFLPFYTLPWKSKKIRILKKKLLEISSFYTCVPKATIIWGIVPDIRSKTDKKFCNFGPFFALLPHYWPQKLKFGKNPKNHRRYYPFLHMCTIINYHMMHSFWDIRRNGKSFLSFWAIFRPLTLPTTQKIKTLKNWKKHLEILSFYTCVPQITVIWRMVPEISSATEIIFCHFGLFFALLTR